MDNVAFEIREQAAPVPGWVVVALFPDGHEEQLLGVFVEEFFARSWARHQGPAWLRRRCAGPELVAVAID